MVGWARFVRVVLTGFFGLVALLGGFVLLTNPYGNLPHLLFTEHFITDINQRFQYPALVRSKQFDSAVIGTSDARLLRPAELDSRFGGHFVNLAMNAATAWEQYRLADLFIRETPHSHMLLMALDHVWCDEEALSQRTTVRGFPDWMYDDNLWNDLPYMLNGKTVELSGRVVADHLGFGAPRFPAGYEVFTPPESAYDSRKAKAKLWSSPEAHVIEAAQPEYVPTDKERQSWRFPALVWLDEILGRFSGRAVVALMPVHAVAQPQPGTRGAARENACKEEMLAVASRHDVVVIDFRIHSAITLNDDNYWDRLHYRLPVAHRIVDEIAKALETTADDPNGDWHYLAGASIASHQARAVVLRDPVRRSEDSR
jgi:hypothetical protein